MLTKAPIEPPAADRRIKAGQMRNIIKQQLLAIHWHVKNTIVFKQPIKPVKKLANPSIPLTAFVASFTGLISL